MLPTSGHICAMVLWQATVEQRKLAVDLAEVIVKWECQRMKEESDDTVPQVCSNNFVMTIVTSLGKLFTHVCLCRQPV